MQVNCRRICALYSLAQHSVQKGINGAFCAGMFLGIVALCSRRNSKMPGSHLSTFLDFVANYLLTSAPNLTEKYVFYLFIYLSEQSKCIKMCNYLFKDVWIWIFCFELGQS